MGIGMGDQLDSSVQLQNMVYPFAGLVGTMMMCASAYVYYFTPFWNTANGILWDYLFLHLTFYCCGLISWILFYKTWKTNPGALAEDYESSKKMNSIEKETLITDDQYGGRSRRQALSIVVNKLMYYSICRQLRMKCAFMYIYKKFLF